jgi:transposase-like protein
MNKTTTVQTPYCPYCGQSYYVVKAGLNDTGSQRMRCQQCRRYFTPNPKPMGYDQSTKEMAVRLYLEGMSFRGVGKVLSVHYLSVINWVNAHEAQLPQQVTDSTPTQTVETDELYTFVGQKNETGKKSTPM